MTTLNMGDRNGAGEGKVRLRRVKAKEKKNKDY